MPSSRRRDRSPGRASRSAVRTAPDACPGAWRRHEAADGALARFRPAGGVVTAAELRLLAGAAVTGGAPLELTSRGSLQVRGLSVGDADDLGDALRGAGAGARSLLDAGGRELPCGLLASPRAAALDDTVAAVAAGLRERPDLPGRFLVALDDGTGDVAALGADVTVARTTTGWALRLGDTGTGVVAADGAALALAAVDAFADAADGQWRLAEVPGGVETVLTQVRARLGAVHERGVRPDRGDEIPDRADRGAPEVGVGPADVLEVLPRLGEIDLRAAAALVDLLDRSGAALRVTPWRTLVVTGLPDPESAADALAAAGLETDPDSPWAGLSACVGAPRCAKSHRDVRGELHAAVASGHVGGGAVNAHWIGCARACGTPGGRVAVVEALRAGPPGPGAYRTVVRAGRGR